LWSGPRNRPCRQAVNGSGGFFSPLQGLFENPIKFVSREYTTPFHRHYYVGIIRTRQGHFATSVYSLPMPRLPKQSRAPVIDTPHSLIGQRIARLRKAQGITQKELAEKIGVTRTVITDYECGRVRIYDEMLARLAAVLNASTDELLGLKDSLTSEGPSLRLAKRIRELDQLPEQKRKAILKTLDDLIRANS